MNAEDVGPPREIPLGSRVAVLLDVVERHPEGDVVETIWWHEGIATGAVRRSFSDGELYVPVRFASDHADLIHTGRIMRVVPRRHA